MTNNEFDISHDKALAEGKPTNSVCIITDKVYSHCQQRECFPEFKQELLDGSSFESIRFLQGFIVEDSLRVTELTNRTNFKRVRFTLRVPFEITSENGKIIEGYLPEIYKDVILFIPPARDEFDFRIVVDTNSQLLAEPLIDNNIAIMSVGVFFTIKVVGRVQLLIPSYGYCPAPPECEEFSPDGDIRQEFDFRPFPDFFPQQSEDIVPK